MNGVDISVIMPAHNAEAFIFSAIESIVKQDFENWELIVVDDASTDKTRDIVLSFHDPRIKLLSLAKNLGNYPARNIGLAEARGQYVAVLDADDVSIENRLHVQYDYMEEHFEIAVIGCGYQTIDVMGREIGCVPRVCRYEELRVKLLADNFMLHSTIFVRREFIRRHGIKYNEIYKYAADYDFVYQCSRYSEVLNTADTLVRYRVHPDGITATKFMEQQKYASQIRSTIFQQYYGDILQPVDYTLIDQLFSQFPQKKELMKAEDVELLLNRLLVYNAKQNLFPNDLLHDLFYQYVAKLVLAERLI